jgi:hypothetical protein
MPRRRVRGRRARMSDELHVLRLVGIRPDGESRSFYRWAFLDTAAAIAVMALDEAVEALDEVRGFTGWHLECRCGWRSATSRRPKELAGAGFVHLMLVKL